jgi:DNA-binding response OmpR family regulator
MSAMLAQSVETRDPLSGKRVLVAEDEPLIAMDFANRLAEAGAEVVAKCATVRDGLAVLTKSETGIDVAVVDFVLADRNSEPLQVALRQRDIPFVVVSAYPRVLVRTCPADHILQKPVTAQALCDEVRDLCRRAA